MEALSGLEGVHFAYILTKKVVPAVPEPLPSVARPPPADDDDDEDGEDGDEGAGDDASNSGNSEQSSGPRQEEL